MQLSLNIEGVEETLAPFFEHLEHADSRVLMLDYDGTLAPFTPDRSRALPYPDIPGLISRIMACHTRVVLVSGRAASELLLICGIYPHPEIWGSHGAEHLYPDGSYRLEPLMPMQKRGLEILKHTLIDDGLAEHIENKPTGIAVHWRGLPAGEPAAIESKVRAVYSTQISHYGLELFRFDGGLEIRSGARNKGDAVRAVLQDLPAQAAAAYLGDDQTDEDAFRAIKGHGLAVLVRDQLRPTDADICLRPPDELKRFFEDWLIACGAAQ